MKIGFSTLTLIGHRQDSSPKTTQPAAAKVTLQNREPITAPAPRDDLFSQRIKKQQEAFKSLASLPSPKEASQQQATQKVGFLRQRIEMLKAMMAFASPQQLKNMAKELKSIAGQLAGAAKQLGDSGGGMGSIAIPSLANVGGASPATLASGQEDSGQNPENVAQAVQQAEAEASTAQEEADKAAELEAEQDTSGSAEDAEEEGIALSASVTTLTVHQSESRSASTSPSVSEHILRGALTDAQKELREAVSALKIRLREEDKEARRELQKAEKEMRKTDEAIAQSTSNALYSEVGQLVRTSLSDMAVSTSSIHIEV